jgi:hypothetical protein
MKTAAEYRALADEETQDDEVRMPLLQLAQVWLDAASKLDGLPSTRTRRRVEKRRSARGGQNNEDDQAVKGRSHLERTLPRRRYRDLRCARGRASRLGCHRNSRS